MTNLLLRDFELVYAREQVARTLPGTCVIQAATLTPDGSGGNTETWAAVTGGTVACRVDPMIARLSVETVAQREANEVRLLLTTPFNSPLAAGQRVVIETHKYEVRELRVDHSWNVSRNAEIVEIRSGE